MSAAPGCAIQSAIQVCAIQVCAIRVCVIQVCVIQVCVIQVCMIQVGRKRCDRLALWGGHDHCH
jgi:hypothetical protein